MSKEIKNVDSGIEYASNKELQDELDKMYDVWEMTNEVSSLSDFEEIVRELTKREYNV